MTTTESAITREWISYLSKKDRALFDRAHARAQAIIAEHGTTDPEMQRTYVTLLAVHRIVGELMASPPDTIKEWGRQEPGDAAILANFADWCEREDAYLAAVLVDPDTEIGEQADEIATEIMQFPASGAAGLAVKTYLMIYQYHHLTSLEDAPGGAKTLVGDLARFAPVLESRCRTYLTAAAAELSPAGRV